MKTNFLKSIVTLALVAGLSTSCVDDQYETPTFDCVETTLEKNKEVGDIPASSVVKQYLENDIIEAYAVSSDKDGNFFKTVSFQTLDGTRAFSVPMDVSGTFTSFEPGRKVLIKMQNLYTDVSNGGMRIGGLFVSNSGFPGVGRLTRAQVQASLVKTCDITSEENLVRSVTIPQLTANDAFVNKLVELDNVQFSNQAIDDTYYTSTQDIGGATNHLLEDIDGRTIVFRTSSFAAFANKPVNNRRGKVRGILTKFGSTYQFVARYESDIRLTLDRIEPLFSENFESVSAGTNIVVDIPGWTNVSMNNGNEKWEARQFPLNTGNKFAQFSPFGISPAENNVDTRLITPAIDLGQTSGPRFVRFGSKIGFANGEAVTFWISTNYVPAAPGSTNLQQAAAVNAATWTILTATFAPQSTSFPQDFTSSGNVDLSSYTGNVHFSFRYVGGTNSITSTYQIDNIQVIGQ